MEGKEGEGATRSRCMQIVGKETAPWVHARRGKETSLGYMRAGIPCMGEKKTGGCVPRKRQKGCLCKEFLKSLAWDHLSD